MALGDALHEHDDATGDDDTGSGPGGKPTPAEAKKKHRDNMLIIGIALVGVILTYLIYRSNKNASSSSTSTTANPVPSTGQLVGGSSSTTATDPYAEAAVNQLQSQQQQQTSALQGLQTALTNLQDEVSGLSNTPPSAPPQSTAAPATPASPGLGLINLPGIGQSVILGELGQNSYTGYQVGGGAPVYFGNANGVSQGSQQETTGSYAYTPIAYQGLVGSSSSTGGPLPGQH